MRGVEAKTTTFAGGRIDLFLTSAMAPSALTPAGCGMRSDSHAPARHRPGGVAAVSCPVIRLRDVTIADDRHSAVHYLSGVFETGSMTAIAGPNRAAEIHVAQRVDGRIHTDLRVDRARIRYQPISRYSA